MLDDDVDMGDMDDIDMDDMEDIDMDDRVGHNMSPLNHKQCKKMYSIKIVNQ